MFAARVLLLRSFSLPTKPSTLNPKLHTIAAGQSRHSYQGDNQVVHGLVWVAAGLRDVTDYVGQMYGCMEKKQAGSKKNLRSAAKMTMAEGEERRWKS